jgi:hypothetical protein
MFHIRRAIAGRPAAVDATLVSDPAVPAALTLVAPDA